MNIGSNFENCTPPNRKRKKNGTPVKISTFPKMYIFN